MTDVVKLCNSGSLIKNGASTTSATITGNHNTLRAIIITNVHVNGVNGASNNGYLDNRFKPQ